MTKLAALVSLLAGTVMAVLIFEAVKRELSLRQLKQRMAEDQLDVKRKEAAIVQTKGRIQELRNTLNPLNAKRDELYKRRSEVEKQKTGLDNDMLACNNQKVEADKKKAETIENLNKLKSDFEQEKKKAQEDIQALKQNILDRDTALCAFVEKSNDEGRKLCGISEAAR